MNSNKSSSIYSNSIGSNNSNNSNTSYDSSDSEDDSIDWTGHIINNKYIILNQLGHGSYCTVWNTYDIESKNLYAFKIYNLDDTEDGLNEKNILDIIKSYKLNNVILYNKSFEYEYDENKYLIFIMEQCGYSLNEIRKLFREVIKIDNEINLNYFIFITKIQSVIINILENLHKNGYAHTDIKPENILITIPRLESTIIHERIKAIHNQFKKQKNIKILENISKSCNDIIENIDLSDKLIIDYLSNFNFDIKLCDFGTCLKFGDNTIYKKHTTYYKSPKIILKFPLDNTYDYWSLGCTLYELITGEVLFNPFNDDLISLYDDIEDINLMYLISSSIGLPPLNMINNSKISDVIFTFDKKCIRGFKSIKFNNFIQNMLNLETDSNKKILYNLINYVINNVKY